MAAEVDYITRNKTCEHINTSDVKQKADILTRAHVRKMADVTKVIIVGSFNHKTHRNLSEEVRRRFYKN
ncbi:unnamed protein product [Brassica oleracea]